MDESSYIKKLRERLRQKPDSRVFLSLAEELKKKGRMDEALAVLAEGVGKNPEFTAARITLGKWYLLAEMPAEAKQEFLEAARSAPGVLSVHKGLAEAYTRLGDQENAAGEYRKILEINPFDEETASQLESLGHSSAKMESPETEIAAIPAVEPGIPLQEAAEEDIGIPEAERGEFPEPEGSLPALLPTLLKDAERHIAEGSYAQAMRIYNELLVSHRDEKRILQRKEELKSLMALTGADRKDTVGKLNRLSDAVRERFVLYLAVGKKEIAVSRLNRFLHKTKVRLSPPSASPGSHA